MWVGAYVTYSHNILYYIILGILPILYNIIYYVAMRLTYII